MRRLRFTSVPPQNLVEIADGERDVPNATEEDGDELAASVVADFVFREKSPNGVEMPIGYLQRRQPLYSARRLDTPSKLEDPAGSLIKLAE